MVAIAIPVKSVDEGMLKYSKISRPEAKPAPMTKPINTEDMLMICFMKIAPFVGWGFCVAKLG